MAIRSLLRALLLPAVIAAGCAAPPGPVAEEPSGEPGAVADADRLHDWLTGFFEASSGWYMRAVPILDEHPDRWIYVAQWKAGEAEPERQFVYHFQDPAPRGIALDIYSVLAPLEHPTNPSPEALADIRESSLERRVGCRIRLSQDGLSFVGGTRGRDCPTDYRGAERARIELTVREGEVREWLHGYDAQGARLWSAEQGGRVFRRVEPGREPG